MLTATDKRQCLDEIYFLAKDKRSVVNAKDRIKQARFAQEIEQRLEKKRKAYNFAYANVMKKYHICPDDLYETLDGLWAREDESTPFSKDVETRLAKMGTIKRLFISHLTYGASELVSSVCGVSRQEKVWSGYIKLTQDLAKELVDNGK